MFKVQDSSPRGLSNFFSLLNRGNCGMIFKGQSHANLLSPEVTGHDTGQW